MGTKNNFFWHADTTASFLKVISDKEQKKFSLKDLNPPENSSCILISPKQNKAMVLDVNGINEWNFRTGKHQRELFIDGLVEGGGRSEFALSRDGQTFLHAKETSFLQGDTTSGKTTRTTRLQNIRFHESLILSPYGRYAFYDQPGAPFRWGVVSTQTGKRLWGFSIPPIVSPLWAVSDDETTIVVPADKEWQVRDLQNGAVLRRLPFVVGVRAASLSPDGATLYCVANGVLYRQRAR